jgi:hypothetical protein
VFAINLGVGDKFQFISKNNNASNVKWTLFSPSTYLASGLASQDSYSYSLSETGSYYLVLDTINNSSASENYDFQVSSGKLELPFNTSVSGSVYAGNPVRYGFRLDQPGWLAFDQCIYLPSFWLLEVGEF